MRTPSALELLDTWERSIAEAPAQRAMELLAVADPEATMDSLDELSVGQRDAKLLMLRELLFGSQMAAVIVCPRCCGRLELNFDACEVRANFEQQTRAEISLDVAGYGISFRSPTSRDVIAAVGEPDMVSSRHAIIQRCLLSVQQEGTSVNPDQLPPEVIERVAEQMAKVDLLADIQISVICPACEHGWRTAFDIMSFLWTEIDAWAWRILHEVHTLASSYGWRERDILELSPMRRQFYLEAIGT
jgi:hypothetical protein